MRERSTLDTITNKPGGTATVQNNWDAKGLFPRKPWKKREMLKSQVQKSYEQPNSAWWQLLPR